MRNIKRIITLFLALAFGLSMFAGAIPDIKGPDDGETLTTMAQSRAWYVLDALGVVKGDLSGNSMGDKGLTRAEMCAVLYRLCSGDADDARIGYFGYTCSAFTDVEEDSWYTPYVNWAYGRGAVEGYGNGMFGPDDFVTADQACKMLVCVLGYNAGTEGIAGSNWAYTAENLASSSGILKGLSSEYSFKDDLIRRDMFVMVYNTLNAQTVRYGGTEVYDSGVTLGEKSYGVLIIDGAVLVANNEIGTGAYWGNAAADKSNTGDWLEDSGVYGNVVYYYYKPSTNEHYARFVYKQYTDNPVAGYSTVLVNVDLGDNYAEYGELGRKYTLVLKNADTVNDTNYLHLVYGVPMEDETGDQYIKADGQSADISFPSMRDYAEETAAYGADGTKLVNGTAVSGASAARATDINSTAAVRYTDNDGDGTADHLFASGYQLARVYKTDSESYTLYSPIYKGASDDENSTVSSIPASAVLLNGTPEAGNYIYAYYNAAEGQWYVKTLDEVTAHVTAYTMGSGEWTLSDGGTYTYAQYFTCDPAYSAGDGDVYSTLSDIKSVIGAGADTVSDTDYKFIVDQDGEHKFIVLVAVDEDATDYTGKYAVVTDISEATYLGYPAVQIWTEDNEAVTYYLSSVNGHDVYSSYLLPDGYTTGGGTFTGGFSTAREALACRYDFETGDLIYINSCDSPFISVTTAGCPDNFYTDNYVAADPYNAVASGPVGYGWDVTFDTYVCTDKGDDAESSVFRTYSWTVSAENVQMLYAGNTWQAKAYVTNGYLADDFAGLASGDGVLLINTFGSKQDAFDQYGFLNNYLNAGSDLTGENARELVSDSYAGTRIFNGSKGVVFAYGIIAGTGSYAWRAYYSGEFSAIDYATGLYGDDSGDNLVIPGVTSSYYPENAPACDEIIYGLDGASPNVYIKAAKVTTSAGVNDTLPSGWINRTETTDGFTKAYVMFDRVTSYGTGTVTFSTLETNGGAGSYTTSESSYITMDVCHRGDMLCLTMDKTGAVVSVRILVKADFSSLMSFICGGYTYTRNTVTGVELSYKEDTVSISGCMDDGSAFVYTYGTDTLFYFDCDGNSGMDSLSGVGALAFYNKFKSGADCYIYAASGTAANPSGNISGIVLISPDLT